MLPIHRVLAGVDPRDVIAKLDGPFRVEHVGAPDPEALTAELATPQQGAARFVAFTATEAWRLTLADADAARAAMPDDRSDAWRALDVSLLHALVFERLLEGVTPRFVHAASEAHDLIASGEASMAFLLAPMPFDAVRAVAEAGDAMPQKSTYFIPKPKTGVLFRPLT